MDSPQPTHAFTRSRAAAITMHVSKVHNSFVSRHKLAYAHPHLSTPSYRPRAYPSAMPGLSYAASYEYPGLAQQRIDWSRGYTKNSCSARSRNDRNQVIQKYPRHLQTHRNADLTFKARLCCSRSLRDVSSRTRMLMQEYILAQRTIGRHNAKCRSFNR